MDTLLEQVSLVGMIAGVAERTPDRAAVVSGNVSISYGELHERANRVARYLRGRGAGAETKVGIALGRSIEFVVAALGVMKAGAGYVPVDPSYPEARRRMIAGDAGLLVVLGDEGGLGVECVGLGDAGILEQDGEELEGVEGREEDLAYVIYTSGSTGVPKGVEVTRGNLRHLVEWHVGAFGLKAGDKGTLLANVGFDAAVWELWPYLCAGGTVVIPGAEVVRQPEALRDFVVEHGVDVMFAPTLLAERLMQFEWPAGTRLRTMLTGGDALRTAPQGNLPFTVVNNYGPAECTVVATSGALSTERAGMPFIGWAIRGAEVWLLDAGMREVEPGAAGEICIGGAGVARGYLGQPGMTAERFVMRDGRRMYRSGDLGSRNADGSIQFLGRMDGQVKIRGYRIECGEIEAALNRIPGVDGSLVVVREDGGHRALVGYVGADEGVGLSHEGLRGGLRAVLPEYMVPEQFVRLERLPVNENGKLDRRRLPEPSVANIVASAEVAASRVELELSEILKGLLEVDAIAREDDFFLLGGHSFIAAQVIARVRDRFGVELSLRAVFEHPTLAEMAGQIERRMTVVQG